MNHETSSFGNPEVLSFINRLRESIPNSVEIFTNGGCVQFCLILSERFPNGQLMYDENHAIFRLDQFCYDITGKVEQGSSIPLTDFSPHKIDKILSIGRDIEKRFALKIQENIIKTSIEQGKQAAENLMRLNQFFEFLWRKNICEIPDKTSIESESMKQVSEFLKSEGFKNYEDELPIHVDYDYHSDNLRFTEQDQSVDMNEIKAQQDEISSKSLAVQFQIWMSEEANRKRVHETSVVQNWPSEAHVGHAYDMFIEERFNSQNSEKS